MHVSIVVPAYRSAECLAELAKQVGQQVGSFTKDFELVLVNDCSPDETWQVISFLAEKYEFVVGINLRKNVGQDNAIMAGLHHAKGDVIIIMDDDLQHDPADVAPLCQTIDRGFDVVYANFDVKKQAVWKNLGSWFNGKVAEVVLGKPPEIYMSPYKAIRKEVVQEIIKYDGPFSYVDGILFSITSNIGQIDATHHDRFAGESNYNLIKSIQVWLKLVTSFSVFPLRIATFAGLIISVFSFLMAAFFVIQFLVLEQMPEGWPSLIVTVLFLGGIQLIGIGAVGEYIGRMFITQNKRQQFIVKEVRR